MVTIQRPGASELKKRVSGKAFAFNPDFAVDEDLKVQQNIKGESQSVHMVVWFFGLRS